MMSEIDKAAFELLKDERLFKDTYKMKCLKWHQRLSIFINSWIKVIQLLPLIIKHIKKEEDNGE